MRLFVNTCVDMIFSDLPFGMRLALWDQVRLTIEVLKNLMRIIDVLTVSDNFCVGFYVHAL